MAPRVDNTEGPGTMHIRIVNVAVVVATAVNADGHREVLGIDAVTTGDGTA